MISLPELAGGRIHYRLPAAEETAIRLADVLLANSARQRAELLESALASDPPLAVWAVLVAPEPADPAAPLSAVAAWLGPRIATLFTGSSAASQNADWDTTKQSQFERLLADARHSAAAIAGPAGTAGTADRNRQFLGFAAGAVEWLMLSGTPQPERHEAAEMLPSWLARAMAPSREQAPAPNSSSGNGQPLGHATSQVTTPEWAGLLARLAARTVRLDALQADFAGAVEQEKLAALKEFAYGAGHEINNPLANISARAQTLLKDESDPERRQKLAAINTQAFRAHEMIADLMLFAQPPEWKPVRVAIGPLVAELETAWRRQATEQQTAFHVRIADDSLAAWADRSALAVALRALVANALEALGRGGTVELTIAPTRLADAITASAGAANLPDTAVAAPDAVAICISDDGPGIDPQVRPRIFDPFYSGREAGRGLGFGLPKCWRIATAMGGRIDVASGPAGGAKFTLVLPLAERS
ncbi:MAG TPA: ATP-binding protein [Pirellulales bacterium]|nr:ATP-binding protein [Pirellulales bacterium]